MPVLDSVVDNKTKIGNEFKYGCWGRTKYADGYFAPTHESGHVSYEEWVPNRMSKSCRYDMSEKDPACGGCHCVGLGRQYEELVRGNT